jgi:hypothetical protein
MELLLMFRGVSECIEKLILGYKEDFKQSNRGFLEECQWDYKLLHKITGLAKIYQKTWPQTWRYCTLDYNYFYKGTVRGAHR